MSRNLDISPLFVFVVMLFGGAIGGILGIIVAIPLAGIIKIFYSDFHAKQKKRFVYGVEHSKKEATKPRKRRRSAMKRGEK